MFLSQTSLLFVRFSFLFSFFFSPLHSSSLETINLSLEEKVGQLLMVHFHGESANQEARTLIYQANIGAFIFYNWANGLHSPAQIRKLSSSLQDLAKQSSHGIPLLIAVDQEGGAVARLTDGFTLFPGNATLGKTEDPKLAEWCAFAMGQELLAVGVNMNLAPVVDINPSSNHSCMGTRSFGTTAKKVFAFGESALKGYHAAGIMTTLKHFPGHGSAEVDSHVDLPKIKKNRKELEQNELYPFKMLCSQADAVMTAHLLVEELDPLYCTTLSKPSLDILRNEMNFNGIVISDSLVMEGLVKSCKSLEETAILALNAGCDLLLLGGKQLIGTQQDREITAADVLKIHQSLVHAVKSGRISQQRLDEAVQRILELKERYLGQPSVLIELPLEECVGTKEHRNLAQVILEREDQ